MRLILLMSTLVACDDPSATDKTGDTAGGPEEGFCAVQAIFDRQCVACHDASSPSGDLDLETDAHAALVGVASALYTGRTLVVEGDPDASFLYVKVTGGQAGTEGDPMPPGGGLSAADADVVRTWIVEGATSACSSPDTGPIGTYHPAGWDAPDRHGLAAKLQEDDCLACHGDDLTGGEVGVSCDTCHEADRADGEAAWREDCTFCHGGGDNGTGAPPEGIRDETDAADLTFPVHTTHVEVTELKTALDCVQCHTKPTDIFSSGHLFVGDGTPGVAEVAFGGGLSDAAHWSAGTCTNVYCHGNGQGDNGTVSVDSDVRCGSCHAVTASGEGAWGRMSGEHDEHIDEGVRCYECHADVVDSGENVTDAELHVDGEVDVHLRDGMTYTNGRCTGSCHGESHNGRSWD